MLPGLLDEGDLLDKKGVLAQSGYALSQVKRYDRKAIRGKRLRIKEWDYYYFGDEKFGVALTVADNSYMSLGSVSLLDFTHLRYVTRSKMGFLPCGKLKMPPSCSEGNVHFKKGGAEISFTLDADGSRTLKARYKKFVDKRDFYCEITLAPAYGDNITVAIPFTKRKHFYYNTKINCLHCTGFFKVGDETHRFENAFGGLDWGRGVWPYKNRWYWSSLSCEIDGKDFGLNLGYGFGKPVASENVIFSDGKAHKLRNVKFEIPYTNGKLNYLKPWKITDDLDRLSLLFYPVIDRRDHMSALLVASDQHQVFGKFYGTATLDDGTAVEIIDKLGFAEHVKNKW